MHMEEEQKKITEKIKNLRKTAFMFCGGGYTNIVNIPQGGIKRTESRIMARIMDQKKNKQSKPKRGHFYG